MRQTKKLLKYLDKYFHLLNIIIAAAVEFADNFLQTMSGKKMH